MSKPKRSVVLTSFLQELTDLTNKYGIVVEGCGCCGSPYLSGNKESHDLRYDYDTERYEAV
ncbi:hypothetical protein [Streptomyces pseudogriseolus]|uniref:hypothetical protein n=1 Tax=Streptomyces pseudogriseolus TaxID=36817 RepID=UPI003FA20673